MLNFEQHRLADAEIISVAADGDTVHVAYRDWQEKTCLLEFSGVVGYQSFSPEGRQLSHGLVEMDEPLIAFSCLTAEEDCLDGFKVFSFVEAWQGAKVLRLVAKRVTVVPAVEAGVESGSAACDQMLVDGQVMYVLSDEELREAISRGEWGGLRLGSLDTQGIYDHMRAFALDHRDAFVVALHRVRVDDRRWTAVHLFRAQAKWFRVTVQRVVCESCGMKQLIADPVNSTMYCGVPDWADRMRFALKAGVVGCVACGGVLPLSAIWAEEVRRDSL